MGGCLSGRHEETPKTDGALRLCINELQRLGCLNPGLRQLSWKWSSGRTASISIDAHETHVILSFRISSRGEAGSDKTQRVGLDFTACNFGGQRPWFRCPSCSRRVSVLYFRQGVFVCRPCSGLRYRSQSEGPRDRMLRAANKKRDRLGADYGVDKPVNKPKWVHWATFFRLHDQIANLETSALILAHEELVRRFRT